MTRGGFPCTFAATCPLSSKCWKDWNDKPGTARQKKRPRAPKRRGPEDDSLFHQRQSTNPTHDPRWWEAWEDAAVAMGDLIH